MIATRPRNVPVTATLCSQPVAVAAGDGVVYWREGPRRWCVAYVGRSGPAAVTVAFADVAKTVKRLQACALPKEPFRIVAHAVTTGGGCAPADRPYGDFLTDSTKKLLATIAIEDRPLNVTARGELAWARRRITTIVVPQARKITVAPDLYTLCVALTSGTAKVTVTEADESGAPTACTVAPTKGSDAWYPLWIRFAPWCPHQFLHAGAFKVTAAVVPDLVTHIVVAIGLALREGARAWVPPEHPKRRANKLPVPRRMFGSSCRHPLAASAVQAWLDLYACDQQRPTAVKIKKVQNFTALVLNSPAGPRTDSAVPTCAQAATTSPTSRTCLNCPPGAAEVCRPLVGETPIEVARRRRAVPRCTVRDATQPLSDNNRRLISNVLAAAVLGAGTETSQRPEQSQ